MQQCWEREPDDRPSFSFLVSDITSNLTALSNYLTLSQDFEASGDLHSNQLHTRGSVRYVRDPTLPRGESRPASYFGGSNYSGSYVDIAAAVEDLDNNHEKCSSNNEGEAGSLSNQQFTLNT